MNMILEGKNKEIFQKKLEKIARRFAEQNIEYLIEFRVTNVDKLGNIRIPKGKNKVVIA